MKKRFMAALSVLALVLALPVAAFAAPSPANTTTTGANNVTASVNNANVKVESTTKYAEGTPANANVVASFEITETVAGTVSESKPADRHLHPWQGLRRRQGYRLCPAQQRRQGYPEPHCRQQRQCYL